MEKSAGEGRGVEGGGGGVKERGVEGSEFNFFTCSRGSRNDQQREASSHRVLASTHTRSVSSVQIS